MFSLLSCVCCSLCSCVSLLVAKFTESYEPDSDSFNEQTNLVNWFWFWRTEVQFTTVHKTLSECTGTTCRGESLTGFSPASCIVTSLNSWDCLSQTFVDHHFGPKCCSEAPDKVSNKWSLVTDRHQGFSFRIQFLCSHLEPGLDSCCSLVWPVETSGPLIRFVGCWLL